MQTLDYRSEASKSPNRLLTLGGSDAVLLAILLLLSGLSFWVVYRGASDEPYAGPIRHSDALAQVGLACVLIFAWFQFSVLIGWLIARRRAFFLPARY